METKICTKCGIKKNIDDFYYLKQRNKYQNKCKECVKKQVLEYQKNNFEKIKKQKKEYFKKYRENNIDYFKEKDKKFRSLHENYMKEYSKKYREKHKEYFKEYNKKYNEKKKKERAKNKKTKIKTKEQLELRKFKQQIRCLISKSFSRKKFIKKESTEKILGCNFKQLHKHLLKTYKNNYKIEWDGIEKIHIDHIIPLATAKTQEEVIKLCHYSNLQLLKAHDNMNKSSKLNWKITI